jgi:hypothetical protein
MVTRKFCPYICRYSCSKKTTSPGRIFSAEKIYHCTENTNALYPTWHDRVSNIWKIPQILIVFRPASNFRRRSCRTRSTLSEKISENVHSFSLAVPKDSYCRSWDDLKIYFLNYYFYMKLTVFPFDYCGILLRHLYVNTNEGKKFGKNNFEFFLTVQVLIFYVFCTNYTISQQW